MPLKVNVRTIGGLAEEKLSFKPSISEDVQALASAFTIVAQLALSATNAKALKREMQSAVTTALSASARLLKPGTVEALHVASINALERFAILHFVSVQRAFLKGLEGVVESVDLAAKEQIAASRTGADPEDQARRRQDEVQHAIDVMAGLDVPYTIAVSPTNQLEAYYLEQVRMFLSVLDLTQRTWTSHEPLHTCVEVAMREYGAWASGRSEAAEAVRSYLNYNQQHAQRNTVSDDVRGLSTALENWLSANENLSQRRKERWQAYRKTLAELPDDKSTMFDESFGVRKAFVQPIATYKVAGVKQETNAPIADVAGLLGTLISNRTEGDDLILLCGGPGSGKSTLCRILASELASNDQIHPVFLRLRRVQDSHDILGFLETQLQGLGLIDKISDLALVPNLVLILDGFDELVMASRTKLREFFNALKDDLSTGPLRHAKAIVSGRDTLFPNGAGLPMGAHVISLLPFDRARIAAWGAKWREQHTRGQAKSFYPETLVPDDKQPSSETSPLEHLVSWPLTLHLVARAHTSGSIDLEPQKAGEVEKAVLYRSIVADTALRQEGQAGGRGRLNPSQMRKFVQAIAWEMYSSGREALDVSEGLPILRSILPSATETDLVELADVTIVNQPELTKGDETGFEFVHKSFSEYFAAERIATGIEEVCFKGTQWGAEEETWRMTVGEATRALASLFAIRLLTAEVQEMLEPMLGDFRSFRERESIVASTEAVDVLSDNLERKLQRMEGLVSDFAGGGRLDVVGSTAKASKLVTNDFEGFSNYVSALLFVSVALVGRLRNLDDSAERQVVLAPFVLLRLIHIVQSGDISIDVAFARRALTNIDVTREEESTELSFPPLAPVFLEGVNGFDMPLESAISAVDTEIMISRLENTMLTSIVHLIPGAKGAMAKRARQLRRDPRMRHDDEAIEFLLRMISRHSRRRYEEVRYLDRRLADAFEHHRQDGRLDISLPHVEEVIHRLRDLLQEARYRRMPSGEIYDRAEGILHEMRELAEPGSRRSRGRLKKNA